MKKILILLSLLMCCSAQLGAREVYDINRNWKFFTYNERDSTVVNLPHTWNTDALGGRKDYYRGIGNYLKYVNVRPEWRGKRIFVKFYGANSVADLMVNGKYVAEHRGGSNAFVFEITDYVQYGSNNLLWVVVNNAARIDVLPTAGSENAYGGLFRGVEMIVADQVAIGLDRFGSDGIMFRTAKVSDNNAECVVDVKLNSTVQKQVRLELNVTDANGETVASKEVNHKVNKGVTDAKIPFEIDNPVLWHGRENPYLYNISVRVVDGRNVDEVRTRTGIRAFAVDAFSGFYLNGASYPLRVAVLYRDRATYGSVALEAQLREDLGLICEMGANAVRVAGGAHCREFYHLCDELGLIVMNDSPFTGASSLETKGFYDTESFRENGKQQLEEMIYQLYNHPSVAIWGIFSHPELRGDNPILYMRELNSVAKALDPARLTACVSNKDGEVNTVTDLVVWSHTLGWIEGRPADIAIWRDQIYADPVWNRTKSAVGWRCGGSVYQQDERLERVRASSNWHPENWHTHFHEVYMDALNGDKKFWGLFVGNMFDFGSVRYNWGEGTGVNDYGMVTFDRQTRKDAFYLYKANWNKEEAFVHIVGKRLDVRSGLTQTIKVYSNLAEVSLTVNGESCGSAKGRGGVFTWENVKMRPGENTVVAAGDAAVEDRVAIRVSQSGLLSR